MTETVTEAIVELLELRGLGLKEMPLGIENWGYGMLGRVNKGHHAVHTAEVFSECNPFTGVWSIWT